MIDIKDIEGNIRFSTPINKGSKRKFLLMKEDYITLKFSLDHPIYFHLGDGIDNELGIFELVDLYKPDYNATTGGYDYDLRLDAYYWKWKNKKFFYTPESAGREASWNLTATLKTHLEVFLANLKALGYKFRNDEFDHSIDAALLTSSKLVSYNNTNLIDALTQMAQAWECEWWIDHHKICFGRCEYNKDYPVEFKLNDNVNTMQRSDGQNLYATRIYPFGSTRNIPDTYQKSLIFDVKEVNGRNIADTGRALDIKFFPISVTRKEEYTANVSLGSKPFSTSYTTWVFDKDIAISILGGSYKVISDGISINVSTPFTQIGNRAFLPAGRYNMKACYIYNVSGLSKEISIDSQEIVLSQSQQSDISVKFKVATALDIEKVASNLKIRVYVHVPAPTSTDFLSLFMAYASYEITLLKGASASTSITFLSGSNSGQTYSAIYNPDFLFDAASNVICLPEGITASLGDRYIIGNIIKGKVPANYFSKDDKETTLNGVIQKRLMLPADIPYVDAYRYSPVGERIDIGDPRYDDPDNVEMREEEAIEEIVVFEDEYPKYIGSTTIVPKPRPEFEKDDDGKQTDKQYPIYTFKDTGLKNFTKDFKLKEFRLIFQTGKLAGLDFAIDIKESDNSGTTFEIVRNEDYGRYLPDDVLFPQAAHIENEKDVPADTYILHGFDTAYVSEKMLPDAEMKLLERSKEYVKKSMIDPSTYNCEMNCSYIYNEGNLHTFEVGDCINLINETYFENGRQSRIIGIEHPLDIPYDHLVYTIGETAAYSRLGEIENKIDSLTYKGQTYSGSATAGSGGASVYVIGINDKTLPSDRNVFSSKKALNTFLNKTKPDIAAEHIIFENGILVRKQEIVEASPMALMEEGEAIIEELTIKGEVTTLGELDNVSKAVDETSDTNDVMVRISGASEWTVNNTLFSNVAQLMEKIFPFTISLMGGGVYEIGDVRTINLFWTYDRDIEFQSINGEVMDIGLRAKQYEGVISDTTYTLSAVCNAQTFKKSTSIEFRLKKYYGVSSHEALTNEEILALSGSWAERTQRSTVFNCTSGQYPYYILPTSMVDGIQFWVGGLRNSDWAEEVREVTNAFGHKESYTIFRLNSIQTGVLNIEVK